MENNYSWTLLRADKEQQKIGLLQNQHAYAKDPSASNIMSLGISYLWLFQYQLAWEHFREAISTHSTRGDAFYGMAGVAKWCLCKPEEAVLEWRAGLKSKYARTGGLNIRMPLLLFFASMIRPEIFEKVSAEKLMLAKISDRRIEKWPGPVAKWLLKQVSEEEFQNQVNDAPPDRALDRKWFAEFYQGVANYNLSKALEFKEIMYRLTNMNQPEWLDHNYFLNRIWTEEFFLARYESGMTNTH